MTGSIGEIDRAVASYGAAGRTLATANALPAGQQRRQRELERALRLGEIDRATLVAGDVELASIELSQFEAVV